MVSINNQPQNSQLQVKRIDQETFNYILYTLKTRFEYDCKKLDAETQEAVDAIQQRIKEKIAAKLGNTEGGDIIETGLNRIRETNTLEKGELSRKYHEAVHWLNQTYSPPGIRSM